MNAINDRLAEVDHRLVKIIDYCKQEKITISLAESCTGGYLAHKITNIPGVSRIFDRGVVTYSNAAKTDILGISQSAIEEFGAVSQEIAYQMAENIRLISKTTIALGITGVAGPTGGTDINPVGTVYIGISLPRKTEVYKYHFDYTRREFNDKVLEKTLEL